MTMRDFYRKILLGGTTFAALMLGITGGDAVFAQAPIQAAKTEAAQPLRNYLRSNVIRLPIEFNNQLRGAIQEIQLYCKESPSTTWTLRDKVDPSADAFNIRLQKDGEYAFTMVTLDKQSRAFPENVQQELPGLIVVVDTQRPTVELTNLGQAPEGFMIQCDVRDANLDLGKMHFSFQGGDRVFRQLVPIAGKTNVYCIPSEAVFTGLVRVFAQDMAGNHTVCEEHLNHMGKEQRMESAKVPMQLPAQQVGLPIAAPVVENKLPEPPPMLATDFAKIPPIKQDTSPICQLPEPTIKPIAVRPNGSDEPRLNDGTPLKEGPRLNDGSVQQTNYREPQKRQIVSSTKVFLDYQIENATPAGRVEIWLTRDHGKSWQKHAEDTQRKSPVEVTLPGDGVFGVTLAVSDARGVITPPAVGDAPLGTIEVDTAKPLAQITKIEAAHEAGQHSVHIHWNVKDANLTDTPVDLLYAATVQGPWLPIAKALKSDGQHTWSPPASIGTQIHVRLIARDAAGNETIVNSLEPVTLVVPAPPRAILRGISTGVPIAPLPTK